MKKWYKSAFVFHCNAVNFKYTSIHLFVLILLQQKENLSNYQLCLGGVYKNLESVTF